MDFNKNELTTDEQVYDYVSGAKDRKEVRGVYNTLLNNPLFVEITEADKNTILEKFVL